ncbi:hypothetical protein VTN00DRAFT_9148 [Thermoascus crustaceus]|uniref:uncharacterized protein n=1 Tax=Thermoascus crustaceus TaxID=5088 RepID=UPI0037438DE8
MIVERRTGMEGSKIIVGRSTGGELAAQPWAGPWTEGPQAPSRATGLDARHGQIVLTDGLAKAQHDPLSAWPLPGHMETRPDGGPGTRWRRQEQH